VTAHQTPRDGAPRIAVAGAGLIGRRHLEAIRAAGLTLHSVCDPAPEAAGVAAAHGVPHHPTLAGLLEAGPDGVVLATPNAHHLDGALDCIAARVPVLVEKPIAADLDGARRIVAAGEAAGVPVLTGHHRRHHPVIAAAKARIEAGALGTLVAAHGMAWLAKPDGYFDTPWRRAPGAGPLLVNLIHDVDLMRHLLGEVASVQAMATNRLRGHPVEEAGAALLRFESGVLGTLQVSDAVVAPWSWELTAHDNPAYPPTDQNALWIGGTHGSLALPRGEVWDDGGARDWWRPIARTTLVRGAADPLVAQMANFAAVIRGEAAPVCPGREGMRALAVIEAIREAARTGAAVVP
jgi:predicted dehydrogenase